MLIFLNKSCFLDKIRLSATKVYLDKQSVRILKHFPRVLWNVKLETYMAFR